MLEMPTVRTGESMTLAPPTQPTARARLACGCRVNLCHQQATLLRFVLDTDANQVMLPQRHAPPHGFAPQGLFLDWRKVQRLENKNGVLGGEHNQLLCGLLGKGAGAIALFPPRPFHDTTDPSRLLVLCLAGGKLLLKTLAGLQGAGVLALDISATEKPFSAIRIDRHERVCLVQVDTNRQYPLWVRCVQSEGETAYELAVAKKNRQAVNLFGPLKGRVEVF